MPGWYQAVRSGLLLVVGITMILHETFGTQPAGPLILGTALLLLGFSANDLRTLWNRNGGKE